MDSKIVFKKPSGMFIFYYFLQWIYEYLFSEDIESVSASVFEERETTVDDAAHSTVVVHNPYLTMSIQKQRNMLPISKVSVFI